MKGSGVVTKETVGCGDATEAAVCVDTGLVAPCARLMVVGRVAAPAGPATPAAPAAPAGPAAPAAPADTPAEETIDDGDDDSTERGVETAEDTSSANIWSL